MKIDHFSQSTGCATPFQNNYFHQAEMACQTPKAKIPPAKIWRNLAGGNLLASLPPRIPPAKTPGISSKPTRQETNPCLA
jgi:hypothetical protein